MVDSTAEGATHVPNDKDRHQASKQRDAHASEEDDEEPHARGQSRLLQQHINVRVVSCCTRLQHHPAHGNR